MTIKGNQFRRKQPSVKGFLDATKCCYVIISESASLWFD